MGQELDSQLRMEFDPAIYRLNAIKRAAYQFGDRCFAHLHITDENRILVSLEPKDAKADLASLVGAFRNAVLDQELRELVADETTGVRNLLLAQAFSGTSLIQPEGDTDDYAADALGVTRLQGHASSPSGDA